MRAKELAAKLREFETTPCYIGILQLLDVITQEIRERNDVAVEPEFYKNQGGIQEIKRLKKLLESRQIQRGYDGAYGD